MTELTNGRVEVVAMAIEYDAEGAAYPALTSWLETEENLRESRPEEPVFLLLSPIEAQEMSAFLTACGAQAREMPGEGLQMYKIDSQHTFFETMARFAGGE